MSDPLDSGSNPDQHLRPHDPSRQYAPQDLHCCCGSSECLLLRRNCSILESVEKDVHTAAQLGQALLARHEAYMADAARERLELDARIERLEMDKQELEVENANKIEENKDLLEQLEALNSTLSDSDVKIKALESHLLSTQQTVRRLEAAASRAADVERHLAILEDEQDKLHEELRTSRDAARTHAQRFKEAQRGILDMQDQLERIEKEALRERERHAEVVARMERQRDIEKRLDTAAGRLKGAAATKTLQEQKHSTKIVGHFVRDLLQDNANLQLGIAELREMLMNSNDEIQSLRDQLTQHQPMLQETPSAASTLRAELEPLQEGSALSQEVHIHHHYHVTPKQDPRKPKKKRQGLLPGIFTPPVVSEPSSPRDADHLKIRSSPTAPALLYAVSQGQATPTRPKHRPAWDMASEQSSDLSSSVPSSPAIQQHQVFDSSTGDSDPLTSPTTTFDPSSPTWRMTHDKRSSISSSFSFQPLGISMLGVISDSPPSAVYPQPRYAGSTAEEGDDKVISAAMKSFSGLTIEGTTPSQEATESGDTGFSRDQQLPRRLHRVSSHESIMSLSGGLDIHTLKSRPSQMALRPLGGADAIVTGVVARPTLSRSSAQRSTAALRSHFVGLQTPRSVSNSLEASPSASPATPGASGTLGKLAGWRPWGGGAASSSPSTAAAGPRMPTTQKDKEKDVNRERELHRAPGINQAGAIPGFQQYWLAQKRRGAPARVTPDTIDSDALTDGLRE